MIEGSVIAVSGAPLVSCIMPTYNRRRFVPQAIRYFLRQTYANRELIVVDDGSDPVADLMPQELRIRYIRLSAKLTVGAKRNLACQEAAGELILHWDDDDWSADWRVAYQVAGLLEEGADVCGLDRILYYEPASGESWVYVYPEGRRPWVGVLCYTKDLWKRNPFPEDRPYGADNTFVWNDCPKKIARLADNRFYVAMIHSGNVSPKWTTHPNFHPYPTEQVRALLGADISFYAPAGLTRADG